MKKLILHIGNHKTGTSSIQASLYENRVKLNTQKYYPLFDTPNGEKLTNHGWMLDNIYGKTIDFKNKGARVSKKFYEIIGDKVKKIKEGTLIISCEDFSYIFNHEEVVKLKDFLKLHFDSIKIISYVRRQDKHIRSHHQQACKDSGPASKFFGNSINPDLIIEDYFDNYLDYNKKLNPWVDNFGFNNVIVRVFDVNSLYNNDAVYDFYNSVGIPYYGRKITNNESLPKVKEKIMHIAIASGASKETIKEIKSKMKTNPEKIQNSSKWSEAVVKHYRESNSNLSTRFNLQNHWYNNENNKEINSNYKWEENEVNEVIAYLVKCIENAKGTVIGNADTLRDSAIELESIDLKKSLHLMECARNLRPNGTYINKKIIEYKKILNKTT